ncbi:Cytochrome P450 78A9 [Vitis vinifera]|uniref:Cytochrome P450 78A9 n=1 Tax=Vitis vinifera TaxID=29760 RepID=A0A438I4N2_VITVI|nr:Cytochrome P450 78A9 [Vitis vinifera]
MGTQVESLWVLALAAKCRAFSSETVLVFGPSLGRYWSKRGSKAEAIIPGPRGLPVVGSMSLMVNLAHHNLAAAAERLGAMRLMAFSLGETRAIVTSNPDVAKEILNSSAFADRPVKECAYSLMFNRAIGFAPYGVYWRTLRRIAATHLFSPKQITASETQRSEIAAQMVSLVGSCIGDIRVRDILKRASLHHMILVEEGYDLLGKLNWSDHLPWLAGLDPQKIRFRCSKLVPRVNRFVNRIITEHRAQPGPTTRDFVDVLLSLQQPDKLLDSDIIAVLWEMIFRGTDTVAVLIEWILARMVLHPEFQSRVHDELDRVVGKSRPVKESDIPAMVYLAAVVKEVLRLHPPGPLLSWARLSITDTTVDGYHVPAGSTAMVNMWAITRDPRVWSDPLDFTPDRFVTTPADVEFSLFGSDLRLAPFGSGRRTCPGKTLGLTTATFWVASLLHEFEWVPSDPNPVDLSEVLRLSCEMAHPLTVRVRPRRT